MNEILSAINLPPTKRGRKRWTQDDCLLLEKQGLLRERYELFDGEIVIKSGQSWRHARAIRHFIAYALVLVGPHRVQAQATMEVYEEERKTNCPQPDITILREVI